jgi:histidinol-phosphatase (PHP family)
MNFNQEYRMSFEQMRDYEKTILALKERYKDEIDILLAYEVDYLKNHMDDRVLKADVDYLIGSVHFVNKWGFDDPAFIGDYKNKDIDKIWHEYFFEIENLAKSGLFDIVGHLDLIKVFNFLPKKDVRLIAKDALTAIKKADIVVEINMAGHRKPVKDIYPSESLMEMMAELNIPITFSSDAHKPSEVGMFKEKVITLARTYGYEKCAVFHNRDREMIKF